MAPKKKTPSSPDCPPKPKLSERPSLSIAQTEELAGVFKLLANPTRLRLLHELVRAGELCVGALAEAVEMKPQAVSNQLQRLVDRKVLGARRNGNNIYYQVVDPCVTNLLDFGLCLVEDSVARLADGNGPARARPAPETRP